MGDVNNLLKEGDKERVKSVVSAAYVHIFNLPIQVNGKLTQNLFERANLAFMLHAYKLHRYNIITFSTICMII